jgi:hypothetical protein
LVLLVTPPAGLRSTHGEAHAVSVFGVRRIPLGYHRYEEPHIALVRLGSSAVERAYFQFAPSVPTYFCAAASIRIQSPRSLQGLKLLQLRFLL